MRLRKLRWCWFRESEQTGLANLLIEIGINLSQKLERHLIQMSQGDCLGWARISALQAPVVVLFVSIPIDLTALLGSVYLPGRSGAVAANRL